MKLNLTSPTAVTQISIARRLRAELPGLVLLAAVIAFNAVLLAPEIRIERVAVNDLPFHLAAAQRLGASLVHGEPFLDPWVSQWSLGYPLWRSYQPLPHLLAAGWLGLFGPLMAPATAFALLYYLLLVLSPAALYLGARLFGMRPLACGIAALLFFAPSEAGDFGRYGISYGAYVWRGSGLYTQLVAIDLLALALGLAARAIDTGRWRIAAAIAIAATAMSHLIFGYVAILTVIVLAVAASEQVRARQVARAAFIIGIALALIAWFVVPLLLVSPEVNRCHWDDIWKFDSWGAPVILHQLFSGHLLDDGRVPVLSLALGASVILAAISLRDLTARRLLTLTALWLAIFFGRETWGYLLLPLGIARQFHLHRLQSAFELFALMLTAWALGEALGTAMRSRGVVALTAGIAVGAGMLIIGVERAGFLRLNAEWGESNLARYQAQHRDLDAAMADIAAILKQRPGRVSAGKAAEWGGSFMLGSAPVYSFLTKAHFDQASFLYHSLSSDIMVMRAENDPFDDALFGIRAVVAPATIPAPKAWAPRSRRGNFRVYEASPEGYFSLVDIGARYDGPVALALNPDADWLRSPMLRAGAMVALDKSVHGVPVFSGFDQMPGPPHNLTPRGSVVSETEDGEIYRARVHALRPCYALIKITYFPGLRATVGSQTAPVVRVFPDFCAVKVPPGDHTIVLRYQPGPLKPALFALAVVLVLLAAIAIRGRALAPVEEWATRRLDAVGAMLRDPHVGAALALCVLVVMLARPLFRGMLLDGDDATEYPPRVAELARVLHDHQLPPLWAPDLGSGHGQPLFEFAPPLLYACALPFFALGFRLADCVQFALIVLVAAGAAAMYRVARRMGGSRWASVAVTGMWLFAPYLALDLYVRAAFAESAAVAVAPVALLGTLYALDCPGLIPAALAAAAIALVVLAHNAVALLFIPVLALLTVVRALASRSLRTLCAGGAVIAGGLGLSAVFWLPALIEKDFVKTELLRTDFLNWTNHIISPFQLLWSPWGFGYSVPGPNDGMSFALGLGHLLLALAGVAIAIRSANRRRIADTAVFAAVALAGAWLATQWSSPVWAHVRTLQYMAYPWRTLFLPALAMPLLALYAFQWMGARATALALLALVLINLGHTEPKRYLAFDDEYFYPVSIARKGLNTTTREEYEPRWVAERPAYSGRLLWSDDASVAVRPREQSTGTQSFEVSTAKPARLYDALFYFPGWTATVDGREVAIAPQPVTGLITFAVGAGTHVVALHLRPTPLRAAARDISLGAAAVVIGMLLAGVALRYGVARDRQPVRAARWLAVGAAFSKRGA
ncbi:MAG TPA: hypothetical protein VKB84_06170 [Candidatus Binataceae bacterium]|nr:hypothetical protein [Candidatus Binataceae bacterium]